jgi:hypothetical protein
MEFEAELEGTAWAVDPERIDPDDYPPGAPFAKQMTWAPCSACEVQVHAPVAQVLYLGLRCPRCQAPLLPPPADPEDWIRRLLRGEDELSEQL